MLSSFNVTLQLASTIWPEVLDTYFLNYISCYFHISLNKRGCHTTNIAHTVLTPHCHIDATLVYICQNTTNCKIYCMGYCYMCQKQTWPPSCKYMQNILHVYGRCLSIYVLYMKSLALTMWSLAPARYLINYILLYCHISLNKYGYDIANITHTP